MVPGGLIRNLRELTDKDRPAVRGAAIAIATEGLLALDPSAATRRVVNVQGDTLTIDGRSHDLTSRRVFLFGAGKATLPIGEAISHILEDKLTGGLLVSPDIPSKQETIASVELMESDHPLPTSSSLSAGRRLLALADRVEPDDLVICCFTGGSSALASVPAPGITLEEKRGINEILLSSGLDIVQTNTVRKHISQIKGGRLAARMKGATIINLTVPDVAGNHLDSITDPTVQDTSSPSDAIEALTTSGLWSLLPQSARTYLEMRHDVPDLTHSDIQTVLITTGDEACNSMVHKARSLGYETATLSTDWSGEAADNGARIGRLALDCLDGRGPLEPPCALVACGGESTVALGDWRHAGLGGPNQEFSLAAASVLAGQHEVAVLAIDTDGSDGSTEWAGGLVDGTTASVIGSRVLDNALKTHQSTSALASSSDLVATGPTMTNVNDLYLVVIGAAGVSESISK